MQSISQESIRADAFAVYEIFLQDLGNPPVVQHDSNYYGRLKLSMYNVQCVHSVCCLFIFL
jgi:hypothetical protein